MSIPQETANTVDDYIGKYPAEVRERLERVRRLVRAVAPDAVESISYAIPAYKLKGKPLIYFAGYAKHIGVYPLPEELSSELALAIAPHVAGKGTLQFLNRELLPLDLIEQVVVSRMNHILTSTPRD